MLKRVSRTNNNININYFRVLFKILFKFGVLSRNKFSINFLILYLIILGKAIRLKYIIIIILFRFEDKEINIKLFLNTKILLLDSKATVLFS